MDTMIILLVVALIMGILCEPVRKALGLLLIILGVFECLSIIFIAIGIPSIFLGGFLMFVDGGKK